MNTSAANYQTAKFVMKDAGVKQKQLAKVLGVSERTLRRWMETPEKLPEILDGIDRAREVADSENM